MFATEGGCKRYLERKRWPNGVTCPRCGAKEKVYALAARPFHWVCKSGAETLDKETGELVICHKRNGYRFSVITRTIFQDTKIPLKLWFKIGFLMITAKKGVSSLQVRRMVFGEYSGTDWRTCWYVCHRWRAAMKGDAISLTGEVEVDETYVGGKAFNRHKSAKKQRRGGWDKVAVIGAIARKGMVVAKGIENTDTETLDSFVHSAVGPNVSLVATDEHSGYRLLGRDLPHGVVRHSAGEYVVCAVHTQTIEGFC
ncbi:MAG: IS1595 family transposase [Candidatus Binatus sp.]|nr:IS1595 family transposase [Candidatus Binatus sp.]MDO8434963.1 IS1595 family transposase [Candidatus Binatus sp.]